MIILKYHIIVMIGIIGGMGPFTSLQFYEKILQRTQIKKEQDHIPIVIFSDPTIPDRTTALLTNNIEPVSKKLISICKKAEKIKVGHIVIICNTAHYWIPIIEEHVKTPILNMISLTCEYIAQKGYKNIGLLSTTGIILSGLYERESQKRDFNLIKPNFHDSTILMKIINETKSGIYNAINNQIVRGIISKLKTKGVEVIILGCTELPLLIKENSDFFINPVDIMVDKIIELHNEKK